MVAAFPPSWHHDSLILNKPLGFCLSTVVIGRTFEARYLKWAQSTWEYIGCQYSFATETRFRNYSFAKLFGKIANDHIKKGGFVFATLVRRAMCKIINGHNKEFHINYDVLST